MKVLAVMSIRGSQAKYRIEH